MADYGRTGAAYLPPGQIAAGHGIGPAAGAMAFGRGAAPAGPQVFYQA